LLQSKYYCNSSSKNNALDHGKLKRSVRYAGAQLEINMATDTGNTDIFGTMTDSIEIITGNEDFDHGELEETERKRLILR